MKQRETLDVVRSGGVLRITLNRPAKKNAINSVMWSEMSECLSQAETDAEVRVVVLTGAGGSFCSGADLTEPGPEMHPFDRMTAINDVALTLHRLPKPTIAAVDGDAVGAGCNLALGCDIVLATGRSRFGEIFARRGLSVDFGGSWLLPRLVGLGAAKYLCLTGKLITAEAARELGMVLRIVEEGSLESSVAECVRELMAGAPVSQALTKRLLNASYGESFLDALDAEAAAQITNLATDDAAEARRAFADKREPHFTGTWSG